MEFNFDYIRKLWASFKNVVINIWLLGIWYKGWAVVDFMLLLWEYFVIMFALAEYQIIAVLKSLITPATTHHTTHTGNGS